MAIPNEIKKIRTDLANDIHKFQNILLQYFYTSNISTLGSVVTTLKSDRLKTCENENPTSESNWGYNLSGLFFKLDKYPEKKHPKNINDLTLYVDINIVGDCNNIGTLNDPFKWLVFDLKICGTDSDSGEELITSYHLDRHLYKSGDKEPVEPHPFYHFQFGGKNLLNSEKKINSGSLIVFESPRIAHYPMEIITGIDFIISHFFPDIRKTILCSSQEYNSLLEKYHKMIIKPYFHTISSKWNFNNADLNLSAQWCPTFLCPQFFVVALVVLAIYFSDKVY